MGAVVHDVCAAAPIYHNGREKQQKHIRVQKMLEKPLKTSAKYTMDKRLLLCYNVTRCERARVIPSFFMLLL